MEPGSTQTAPARSARARVPSGAPSSIDATATWVAVSDGEIDGNLSVPLSSQGEQAVTVTVTSNGYGAGFVNTQGQPSQGIAQASVCYAPALLVAAQYQSGSTAVNAGGTVNVTPAPEMPVISAFLAASPRSPAGCSVTGTATYQLSTSYPGGGSAFSSGSIPATGVFSIPNSSFYGGSATVNWTYHSVSQPAFNFSILGQNPAPGTIQAALSGWAVNIGIHESRLQQFVVSPNGPGGSTPGFPVKDIANGFGVMALTSPAPTEDQKWNWQSNITAGQAHLQADMNSGAIWLAGQTQQWNAYNANNPTQSPPAPDYWEGACCTFSMRGTPGAYTYDVAVGLKQYAGASGSGV